MLGGGRVGAKRLHSYFPTGLLIALWLVLVGSQNVGRKVGAAFRLREVVLPVLEKLQSCQGAVMLLETWLTPFC